ncbi:MAG: ABC transporter ATP-binding protein [Dermatophilaceae bacterium]
MEKTLEADAVRFSYDGFLNVVESISFTVAGGSIVGLVGPNGSGKSTLIKNVFDLLRLQSGSITVCGYDHASVEAKSRGVYLASNDFLPEFLSGREYIALLGRLYGIDVDHAKADELFRRFSMEHRYDDLIETYSHGMRKKTQIVSALVMRRPLTIIDETLNGIDLEALHLTVVELRALCDEGGGILLCTHDFALLERVADRVVFIDLGQLVFDRSKEELDERRETLERLVLDHLESDLR